jgi:diguanylate cyclase (GGDEF)-like protein/PAS domain S-box-containing protein
MNDSFNNSAEPRQIKQFDVEFYQAMIDTLQESAFVVENKRFKLVNEAFCRLTGVSQKELIGKQFNSFIYPQNLPIVLDDESEQSSVTRLKTPIVQQRMSKPVPEYHLVVSHISGSTTPIDINSQHFVDAEGKLYQIANVRKKFVEHVLNQALRESEKDLLTLIDHLPNVYYKTDAAGLIKRISRHTANILGYQIKELIGQPLAILYVNSDEHANALARVLNNKGMPIELSVELKCKNNSNIKASLISFSRYDKNQELIGIEAIAQQSPVRAIALLSKNQELIRDPLTKLVNHLAFMEHLAKSIRYARRHQSQLWVLFIKFKNLPVIVEKFGREVADSCLVHFSQRLQNFFRDTDIVARLDDDNFTVLLDDYSDKLELGRLVERLQVVMNKRVAISQYPYGFTFSLGSANFPKHGINSENLINHAESMMYRAQFSKSS